MKKNLKGQYEQYKATTASEIHEVYGRWSQAKENAMQWCKNKMYEQGGYGLRILSANTYQFTVGWIYTDKETGKEMFNVETSNHSYEWEIQ